TCLLLLAIFIVFCHLFGSSAFAGFLIDMNGVLAAPVLYSAFFYSRRYSFLNLLSTLIIIAFVILIIQDDVLQSLYQLTIVGFSIFLFSELFGRTIERKNKIEAELRFMKQALETKVELRTAELKQLNLQLTADMELMKKADRALRESESRLRALIHAIPDSILRIRCDGECLEYKPSGDLEKIVSFNPGETFHLIRIMPEAAANQMIDFVQKTLETQKPQIFEFQQTWEGAVHTYEARLIVMSAAEVLVLIRDMTERKWLEKEILEISQKEQNRIGRDLHDGLGQLLTGVSCLLQGFSQKIIKKLPEEEDSINEISHLVKQAVAQSSWLARGLMPVKLEAGGLESALQDLVEQTERIHKIPCMFHCNVNFPHADPNFLIQLYRIAQEALNNAVKHSQAKHIWIRLEKENHQILLTVKDDGVGLPISHESATGMGLRIMQYRAGMIGAVLDLGRDPEGGSIVQCRLPQDKMPAEKTDSNP
ncbi:MAG: ATP-binding protein, partial [Candidatus Hinthialibacter sp.]